MKKINMFLLVTTLWSVTAQAERLLYVDGNSTPCASYPSLQIDCYPNLQSAYNSIPDTITENHRILVLPGLHTNTNYCHDRYASLCIESPNETTADNWDKTSPTYSLRIEAFDPDNPPIFDGGRAGEFVWLRTGPNRATNLILDNLHITNFQNGILNLIPPDSEGYNAGNEVKNCTISNMGGSDYGYGVISLGNSNNNRIHDNIFMIISNLSDHKLNQYHVVYGGRGTGNIIENNTIINTIGDPIKFAEGAHDSIVRNNYIVSSGKQCYVQSYRYDGGQHAYNIQVYGNTFIYPHERAEDIDLPIKVACCHKDPGWDTCPNGTFLNSDGSQLVGDGNNYVYGHYPSNLEITALASGDFDQNAESEVIKSQLLPTSLAIVDGSVEVGLSYFANHLYSSRAWKAVHFAVGDFDDSGKDQLISAFRANGDRIYRGNGTTSLTDERLYTGDFGDWNVVAMTAGDYFQDGMDDLVVAFESTGGDTKICRGSGTISNEFDPAASGCGSASLLYTSSAWKVHALTTGPFYEDGVEYVAIAFKNNITSRVYLMDATTGSFTKKIFDDTSDMIITAMTSGFFDDSNYQLITAWRTASGTTKVYRGTGTDYGSVNGDGGIKNLGLLYANSSWHVTHLWGNELRSGNGEEVITVFQAPSPNPVQIQVWLGDGSTGLMSYYKLHE